MSIKKLDGNNASIHFDNGKIIRGKSDYSPAPPRQTSVFGILRFFVDEIFIDCQSVGYLVFSAAGTIDHMEPFPRRYSDLIEIQFRIALWALKFFDLAEGILPIPDFKENPFASEKHVCLVIIAGSMNFFNFCQVHDSMILLIFDDDRYNAITS